MKIKHKGDHVSRRRAEYPPLEDLADALYWQSKGNDEPMRKYLARIEEVKKKFPK